MENVLVTSIVNSRFSSPKHPSSIVGQSLFIPEGLPFFPGLLIQLASFIAVLAEPLGVVTGLAELLLEGGYGAGQLVPVISHPLELLIAQATMLGKIIQLHVSLYVDSGLLTPGAKAHHPAIALPACRVSAAVISAFPARRSGSASHIRRIYSNFSLECEKIPDGKAMHQDH